MTSLRYFYLEHISLAIIHATAMERLTLVKTTILLIATTLWLFHTIYILLTLSFMQCEVQSGYSEHACSFIDQRLLVSVQRQPGNVRSRHN